MEVGVKILKRKVVGISLAGLFFFLLFYLNTTIILSSTKDCAISRHNTLASVLHDSIIIDSDDDFISYGFSGIGTKINPYIIENYTITISNSIGIYISGTTKYFSIRNCYVDANNYGIYVEDIVHETASLINNTCINNNYYGIYLRDSSGSILVNNTCINNNYGISLWDSSGSILVNNTCINNNYYGIGMYYSFGSIITNNILYSSGLYIMDTNVENYTTYTVMNNWGNEKEIGYYTNLDKTTLSEPIYGQLILINCTETIVSNQELNNITTGLTLYWCENVTLTNNTCTNNSFYGISLWDSSGSTLTNNTCTNNNDSILMTLSSSTTLVNNTCSNSNIGISLLVSSGTNLVNNTCINNNHGIYLWFSDSCLISYNLLQNNVKYGVFLDSDSDSNMIHHNSFVNNNLGGTSYGTSQACDKGMTNIWYDIETNEGNWWSDWDGIPSYPIDGGEGSVDPFPLGEPVVSEISISINLLIIILVLGLLMIPLSLLNRGRAKN